MLVCVCIIEIAYCDLGHAFVNRSSKENFDIIFNCGKYKNYKINKLIYIYIYIFFTLPFNYRYLGLLGDNNKAKL